MKWFPKVEVEAGDELTDDQKELFKNMEMWSGPDNGIPTGLRFVRGVRVQSSSIVLELLDEFGRVDEEFAVSIDYLVKKHGDFIKHSQPDDAKSSKKELLKALRKAIRKVEKQQPEI